MFSVDEAQRTVLAASSRRPVVRCPLSEVQGLVLAEDVSADLDMPPFDKALVDGFAVRCADLPDGRGTLQVTAQIVAGESSDASPVHAGGAVRIMTGAPVPPGADAVVMQERTEVDPPPGANPAPLAAGPARVSINDPRVKPLQNIMRRGTEMAKGQVVLRSGTRLRPPELGVLAAVGQVKPAVFARPAVRIVATGNEIVDADQAPGPAQIRNSNGPTLSSLVAAAGGSPHYLGIAPDTRADLLRMVAEALDSDIVLLSGGVSVGQLDLVPGVLEELGVRRLFHRVNLKPGKPVWCGLVERSKAGDSRHAAAPQAPPTTLVFGLPGNPVSVVVCFELFVAPAIRSMRGEAHPEPRWVSAALVEDSPYASDRPTYWPAWVDGTEDGYRVRPVVWHGSPDLRALSDANAFVLFPPGDHAHRAGDRLRVLIPEW